MLPDFLVVGTMKGGTTSLARYIGEHPEVCMHPKKELHFFDREPNFRRGLEYYERQFRRVRWGKPCRAMGEATTDYMYFPWIPKRIHEYLPDVKLIFILRHPVERAYSHYWFALLTGAEHVYPFEEALRREKARLRYRDDLYMRRYSYLDRGKYIVQIRRFLRYFPRENMLFLLTEELRERPAETMKRVFEFLEVDPSFVGEGWNRKRYNEGYSPRHLGLHRDIARFTSHPSKAGITVRLAYLFFRKKWPVRDWLFQKGYPPMREETRRRLLRFFRPYNRKLEKFLGRRLPWWYI